MIIFLRGFVARLQNQPLLNGTLLLFVSMTIVNGGNYLLNLLLGRWLGPAAFADLSLVVTLMLMITFVTATLQLIAAKFAAKFTAAGENDRWSTTRRWLSLHAWIIGGLLTALLVGGASLWQSFFRTQSAWPFVILGLGLPIYLAQGVARGSLQGQTRFARLAASYLAEMGVRLAGGLLFVWLGWGVNGAVLAISLSFVATWLIVCETWRWSRQPTWPTRLEKRAILTFSGPVVIAQLSQILINNSDILIVKRFFPAAEAGQYAALALIGRMVFFATWSVVTTLFPIVAQKERRGENHRHLLGFGLGAVGLAATGIIVFAWWQPQWIINLLFGPAYLTMAPLLWLYAVATAVYALANVIINYRLSADNSLGTYFGVAVGLVQVLALTLWHDSLRQVVLVQIGLMGTLLLALIIWDGWLVWQRNGKDWLTNRSRLRGYSLG